MPSGKTHDAVTFFLTAPAGAIAWKLTENVPTASCVFPEGIFGKSSDFLFFIILKAES